MKKVFGFAVFLCVVVSNLAVSAGIKEAGGDVSLLFKCESAPYVDSNFKILGISREFDAGIDLLVIANGEIVGHDSGALVSEAGKFVGEAFNIQFSSNESEVSTLSAKLDSSVLAAGGTDLLICSFEN